MKLSIIFPCKNQSIKLLDNIKSKALPFFDKLNITYEMIIIYDGSNLENQKIMEEGMKDLPLQVKLIPYEDKLGKGHNVSKGILNSNGDYVLFMDADFATDLSAYEEMSNYLDYDMIITSRHCKGAIIPIKQPLFRRLMSFVSRSLIKAKFHFKNITDTQCGFKLIKTSVAKEIVKRQIIDGFAFDVEYLYFCKLNHFSIKEIPCKWVDDADSTVSHPLKTSLKFMKDLKRIKRNKKNYILDKNIKNNL